MHSQGWIQEGWNPPPPDVGPDPDLGQFAGNEGRPWIIVCVQSHPRMFRVEAACSVVLLQFRTCKLLVFRCIGPVSVLEGNNHNFVDKHVDCKSEGQVQKAIKAAPPLTPFFCICYLNVVSPLLVSCRGSTASSLQMSLLHVSWKALQSPCGPSRQVITFSSR